MAEIVRTVARADGGHSESYTWQTLWVQKVCNHGGLVAMAVITV